jgi:transposase InsO family protein
MPRASVCAGRSLALRHDHASTFMADHFQKQTRFLGISPSYALVGEPETNGVIERPFRTLEEQVIHGRIFQTIDPPRDAVRAFAARCNAERLIAKNRLRSPLDARAAWFGPKATPEGRYTSLRRAA